ncbi:hypothetical protein Tco_0935499 [Tanacetum coccineum]
MGIAEDVIVKVEKFNFLADFVIVDFEADPRVPIVIVDFEADPRDKVFNPGILASKEEKSPNLLSHRGFKAFELISDFSESPMMIYGGNISILDDPFLHFYRP